MIERVSYDIKKHWLIIIALIIHTILIIFFCFTPFDSIVIQDIIKNPLSQAPVIFTPSSQNVQENNAPQEQAVKPEEPESVGVAALKPRASVFGVTDEEQDIPEFTPGMTDSESKNDDDGSELEVKSEHEQEKTDQALISEETENKILQGTEITAQMQDKGIEEKKSEADALKKVEELKETNVQKESRAQESRHNTGSGKKNAAPIKRTLSFSDLARGFIESLRNEGDDWLKRDGDENLRPGMQELKYLSYIQKIYWNLQNIIKHNNLVPEKNWPSFLEATFYLRFNRQGTIEDIYLAKNSGCKEYDEYCINIFRTNTTGYPPIPSHIHEDHMTLPFSIILSVERPRIRFMYTAQ